MINSYLVFCGFACGLGDGRFSVPEPEFSIQGYASATSSHAAAHKAHISLNPLGYMGLNAGGLKVPLYGIITGIWHAKPSTNPHKHNITVNSVVAGTGSMHKINI